MTLNNGVSMPQLGLGVWHIPNEQASEVVLSALRSGYRSVDTAAIYGNEAGVGEGIAQFLAENDEVRWSDLFITTKLWNSEQGYQRALTAFEESLRKLGLDYVDLYLIHWPQPKDGKYAETWRAFEDIYSFGQAKAIGVSNFEPEHLQRLIDLGGTVPAINQIELHPLLQQCELREFHARHGIHTEAWSPLAQGNLLKDGTLTKIARKHGKTPAQVILRWHVQKGIVVIPKSITPERIASNIDVFDFRLSGADIAVIDAMDRGGRIGQHPNNVNSED